MVIFLVEVEVPEHVTEDNIRGIFDFIHGSVLSLTRAAEHRNEAESEEQTCPLCGGKGSYHNGREWQTCINCKGTGHV